MVGSLSPAVTIFREERAAMERADVLIIDDDQSWVQSVSQLLDDAGLAVRAATDGEQALDLFATEQPALVILDVHLPRINGLELLRQFRQRDRQTPVLMISAEDQASIQDRAMSAGATAFLRKPISVALLMRAVRRYLGDRGVSQRRR
jgi:DNA-binding response OmpR family regulator